MMVMKGNNGNPDQELPEVLSRHIRREINNFMQKMNNIETKIFQRANRKKSPLPSHQEQKRQLELQKEMTFFYSSTRRQIFTETDLGKNCLLTKAERCKFVTFSLSVGQPAKLKRMSSQAGWQDIGLYKRTVMSTKPAELSLEVLPEDAALMNIYLYPTCISVATAVKSQL